MKETIKKLVARQDLTTAEAAHAMDLVLDGGATAAQIAAFLTALRMKGETIDEITGCAATMKAKASHIKPQVSGYIDCVGTGGDSTNTFNISTTAAFIIAGAGIPIAKHGNRAISSRSGSADLLEELGVNIMLEPEQTQACVEQIGIGFMFARTFHKYMKTASQVRSELGVRSVFNILGPISNPSDAKCQVIGVFDKNLVNPLANAMKNMGVQQGMVMSGMDDGMDEMSTLGATAVSEIRDGTVTDYITFPEDFGLPRAKTEDIRGGTAKENAVYTMEILQGVHGPKRDIAVLNAGAAIYCAGRTQSIAAGISLAQETLDNGRAMEKYKQLAALSNSFGKLSKSRISPAQDCRLDA